MEGEKVFAGERGKTTLEKGADLRLALRQIGTYLPRCGRAASAIPLGR